MSKTIDFLPFHPEIKIIQDDEMFRINTDTMALGEFIEVYREETVLDIGTNNGALLIYASLFKPKKLIGLDVNEKALELAKINLDNNNISNYELIHDNAITYKGEEVDVIICNPPYFKTREEDRGNNYYLSLAKHEIDLSLEKLISCINRNLKNNGKLFFLFQTSRLVEVLDVLSKNKFFVKNLKFIYDENKEYSNVFVLKAVKNGRSGVVVHKPLIISRKLN